MRIRTEEANSQWGAPPGHYFAKFKAVERSSGQYGDRLEWCFEIADGPFKGKFVSRTTGAARTSHQKNTCRIMLNRLFSRMIPPEEEVDTDECVGRLYQIEVGPKQSGKGVCVTNVTQFRSAPAVPATTPAAGAVPPPRTAAAPAIPERRFWVEQAGGAQPPVVLPASEIAAQVAGGADPWLCACDQPDAGWARASKLGFAPPAPAPATRNGTPPVPPRRTPAPAAGEMPAMKPAWVGTNNGRSEGNVQEVPY